MSVLCQCPGPTGDTQDRKQCPKLLCFGRNVLFNRIALVTFAIGHNQMKLA